MNPLTKITGQRAALDWPLDANSVMFMFVTVTPELAAEWLKLNRKNRKLKSTTMTAYTMDMRNGAWMLTHQGIAFDEDGNLVDGQHRLMSVLAAKRPVTMLVSAGWPTGEKRKTMDAVDRGVARSLADQLSIQHGITDAKMVVTIVNGLAAPCLGNFRVFKGTTDCILGVFEIYKEEIKWLIANPVKTHGLKQQAVLATMALGRAVWPEKTAEFYQRLVTGENLDSKSPILHLRNYLMGTGSRATTFESRNPITYHLWAFVEGKAVTQLIHASDAGFVRLMELNKDRAEKVRAIYQSADNQTVCSPAAAAPQVNGNGSAEAQEEEEIPESEMHPAKRGGIKIGSTLSKRFTSLDLTARLPRNQNAGYWLMHWRNKRWIDPAGPNEFVKTETFGK